MLFTVLGMVLFGLLMVLSSSFIFAQERTGFGLSFVSKQLVFAALGFGCLYIASLVDYTRWWDWGYAILILATLLLLLVMIPGVGTKIGGAQRWLRMGPLSFQPGEFAKFALILFVARQLDVKGGRLHNISAGVLANFVVPLPALLLLLAQPDFGTTVIICTVIVALMFLAGVPKRYLAVTFTLALAVGAWLMLSTPYRRQRLMTFLDPWQDPGGTGFQIIQSLVGVSHGGFWGVGLGNGKEKLFYLPEAHNDFIFAVIGEELGFLGVIGLVCTYLYFVYRGLLISWNSHVVHRDRFGLYLGAGITLALGLQGLVNMAVVLGLVPTKGLNLPFISYGGSALIVDLFAVGILLSIARGPRSVRSPTRG